MTRREALARTAAAGLAPLAVAPAARALKLDELRKLEREAVGGAVHAEQVAAVAFEAIANSGVLDDRTTATVRVLLDHATEHAELLAEEYKDAYDEEPPLPPRRTEIPGLESLRSERDALRLATRLENQAIAAHVAAVRRTHKGQLLKLIAGVAGSDAQGLVLLRQLLGRATVPSAFERGRA
ncbi:MAG TPA: ferritin-like domain-containing protein [Thermoleophilaceae bacterium]|nr:ferritin-like domain-containing protein [Thermoleophilaceae bacterium]